MSFRRPAPRKLSSAKCFDPDPHSVSVALTLSLVNETIPDIARGVTEVSDGPYRSLDMPRHWKRLAKRASNAACDDQERNEALAGALQRDWVLEVPAGLPGRLRDILDDRQGDLLGDSAPERLEVLRGETADSPLASILVDCAAQALHEGYSGDDAVVKATADTLQERACSSRRQVEEHWLRESSGPQRHAHEEPYRRRHCRGGCECDREGLPWLRQRHVVASPTQEDRDRRRRAVVVSMAAT